MLVECYKFCNALSRSPVSAGDKHIAKVSQSNFPDVVNFFPDFSPTSATPPRYFHVSRKVVTLVCDHAGTYVQLRTVVNSFFKLKNQQRAECLLSSSGIWSTQTNATQQPLAVPHISSETAARLIVGGIYSSCRHSDGSHDDCAGSHSDGCRCCHDNNNNNKTYPISSTVQGWANTLNLDYMESIV